MNSDLKIRFAIRNDLMAIVDIYNQAIRSKCATGDLNEFTQEQRIDWFNKFNSKKNHYILLKWIVKW